MKTALVLLSVLLFAGLGPLSTAKTRAKTVNKRPASTTRHTTTTHGRSRGHARKWVAQAPPRLHVQEEPTPDRYREIQGALATKGYLKSPPSGAWDPETQDAMRRYQTDNRFEATGRINSRSLIGLGLGGGPQQ